MHYGASTFNGTSMFQSFLNLSGDGIKFVLHPLNIYIFLALACSLENAPCIGMSSIEQELPYVCYAMASSAIVALQVSLDLILTAMATGQ